MDHSLQFTVNDWPSNSRFQNDNSACTSRHHAHPGATLKRKGSRKVGRQCFFGSVPACSSNQGRNTIEPGWRIPWMNLWLRRSVQFISFLFYLGHLTDSVKGWLEHLLRQCPYKRDMCAKRCAKTSANRCANPGHSWWSPMVGHAIPIRVISIISWPVAKHAGLLAWQGWECNKEILHWRCFPCLPRDAKNWQLDCTWKLSLPLTTSWLALAVSHINSHIIMAEGIVKSKVWHGLTDHKRQDALFASGSSGGQMVDGLKSSPAMWVTLTTKGHEISEGTKPVDIRSSRAASNFGDTRTLHELAP